MECAYCHAPLLGRHWRFCDGTCRQAAYRRRRAGLPEDHRAGDGRRGRVPLAGKTRAEQLAALKAELDALRSKLAKDGDEQAAIQAGVRLLKANQGLATAAHRLRAAIRADREDIAERDAKMAP